MSATLSITSDSAKTAARWRAVVTRATSVGTFVYSVRTTGIYCRPSCPARLARRANVEFFDSAAQAEAAGFRPCKRCCPNLNSAENPQLRVIQAGCDSIADAIASGRNIKLSELAAVANLTPSYYHRVFKKITGATPGQYAKEIRKRAHTTDGIGRTVQSKGSFGISDNGDSFMDEFIDWNGI
ncbi:hypothetical protein SI65_00923 [Aspergillus cristatus]|uniref:HTH araC/xylS-type domain-containing protein n=1 Tax=Aspergillus cristatus TaxID=573508 RepID=A0A1E3BQS9_ASPCR|nr:hypothetical protein SI65_00923 [Aspergillus cristatus]